MQTALYERQRLAHFYRSGSPHTHTTKSPTKDYFCLFYATKAAAAEAAGSGGPVAEAVRGEGDAVEAGMADGSGGSLAAAVISCAGGGCGRDHKIVMPGRWYEVDAEDVS